MVNIATKQTFDGIIASNNKVLVDFYAEWCAPCASLSAVLEEVSEERKDVVMIKVNVESDYQLANKYNIISIPTILVFENGIIVDATVGYINKEELLKLIANND